MSTDAIVTHVVAAVAVIIAASYAVGLLFRRIRQPEVIGQLLAGIMLGPTVLGRLSVLGGPGNISHALFPGQIIPYLNVTSQIALVLFLFAVGYELDLRVLRQQRTAVPVIAAVTFIVPALLGILTACAFESLFRGVGEPEAAKLEFILFIGVAVSITAVPVLASIIAEWRITATVPGVTALAAAALIDAIGWLMLTGVLVLASVSLNGRHAWPRTVAELDCYVVIGILVIRPLLRRWLLRPSAIAGSYIPVAVAFAMGSAWVTAALGLHVIFGAFLAGVIMPRQRDGEPAEDLLRPVTQAGKVLLPIFFMVAGLSVDIASMRGSDFAVLGIVFVVAVLGKLGAGFLAARAMGFTARDSAVVGSLLNTRGLTELIALNIGLSAGLIHRALYTVLVVMAVLTTMATGPLLALLKVGPPSRARAGARPGDRRRSRVILPGNPFPARFRIPRRHGTSSRALVARKIGARGVDSRYRRHHLVRAGSAVDRPRVRRDARLRHVRSRAVRATRRGGPHRRAGPADLGGGCPPPSYRLKQQRVRAGLRRSGRLPGRPGDGRCRRRGPRRGTGHCPRRRWRPPGQCGPGTGSGSPATTACSRPGRGTARPPRRPAR